MSVPQLTVLKVSALVRELRRGFFLISYEAFKASLKESIDADASYAAGCWIDFQDAPMHYLATRYPQTQSQALVRLMLEKAEVVPEDKYRCDSCKGVCRKVAVRSAEHKVFCEDCWQMMKDISAAFYEKQPLGIPHQVSTKGKVN